LIENKAIHRQAALFQEKHDAKKKKGQLSDENKLSRKSLQTHKIPPAPPHTQTDRQTEGNTDNKNTMPKTKAK